MHAASTSYSAELAPDSRLRRIVLLGGAAMCPAGLVLALLLAVATPLKAAVAITWILLCGDQWLALWRGYATGGTLRIAAGGRAERQRRDGTWEPVSLCAGSIVLPRIAWLRVAPRGGRPYAELVCAANRGSEDWRRLQVIWRHIGAA